MRLVPGVRTDKGQVFIQVADTAVEILQPGPGLGGEMAGVEEGLTERMELIANAVSGVCDQLYSGIREAIKKTQPQELTLEFGIKLGGKAGIPFVTEGSAEGTVKVTAKWTTNPKGHGYVPGQIVVTYHADDPRAKDVIFGPESEGIRSIENMHQKLGRYDRRVHPNLQREFNLLSVSEGDETWWLGQLMSRYMLGAASVPDEFRTAFAVSPNHFIMPCAPLTFAFGAHHSTYRTILNDASSSGTGTGVRVKVLDTGLSSSSAVPNTRVVSKVNFVDSAHANDVEDQEGHGTVVSEIIHNLAPDVDFLVYKVKGSTAIIEWDVLAALCDSESADLINCSFAFGLATVTCPTCGNLSHSSRSAVFEGTLRKIQTINKKTIIVVAAGNRGASPVLYPARFRETMAIGSLDTAASRSPASNYGDTDAKGKTHESLFFAPGGNSTEKVGETNPGSKKWDGTSFAAAYTTGLLARLQSDPTYRGDASAVLAALRTSANKKTAMVSFVKTDHGNGTLQI